MEIKFNKLSREQKEEVLSKDYGPEEYEAQIEFLKEDIYGGPLIDTNTMTVIEY